MTKRRKITASRVGLYLAVIVTSVFVAFPIYIIFLLALVPTKYTIYSARPPLIPPTISFVELQAAISSPGFAGAVSLSLEVAFMVGGLALAIGIPTAYGLSRLGSRLAYGLTTVLFVVNMMPSITIAIPLTVPFIKYGLYGSPISIALAQELLALPITTFLLVGAFQSLPREIEQQARVDGANRATAIYRILVPLIAPAIVASFLLAWMLSWDESTFALILGNLNPPTLPVLIFLSVTGRGNPTLAVAFSLIATIPVVILTVLLQKYLRGEDLASGIRG